MDTNDRKHTTSGAPARRAAAERRTRRETQSRKRPDVAVVYTESKPFNRNRFLLQLATVIAVVLALLLGLSIFFKVKNVAVSGSEKYSEWQIRQASGIQDGENLLTVNAARISGKIMTQLPYISQVRVDIELPDTVRIQVVELDVAYAIQSADEAWWLIDSQGKVVEGISAAQAKSYTHIVGVQLDSPVPGNTAIAAEPEPEGTTAEGETVPVTVKGSERLDAALTILQNLELRGILGQAASVDVTSIGALELWYGERYQVLLGDTSRLDYKIHAMKMAIDQSSGYESGILDVSFTTWPDQVGYTPF